MSWLRERVLADDRIDASDLELMRIADSPAEACAIVEAAAPAAREYARRQPRRKVDPRLTRS